MVRAVGTEHNPLRMTQNPTVSVSQLRLIATALLIGPVLFAAVVGWLVWSDGSAGPRISGAVPLALVGIAAANLVMALLLRGVLYGKVRAAEPTLQLTRYASATMTYLALLESTMLLSVVTWLLTREAVPAPVPGALALVIALLTMPSEEHFERVRR